LQRYILIAILQEQTKTLLIGENIMSTQTQTSSKAMSVSTNAGANIVVLAGVGLVVYGLMFLVRNFNGFIELGLTPHHIGGTPDEIQTFSQNLYNYISHLQVALSGFIIALGMAVMALAHFGIRRGEHWALWAAFIAPVVAVGIALPLHFPYHIATLGHLGLIYLDATILLIGTVVSYKALKA
jgi:cytochrome bd-type quinol oxidase subunit 2